MNRHVFASQDDDSKVFLQDGIAGGDRQHSPDENSTSHNAELQDGTFVAAPGRSERVARRLLFTELCVS